MTAEEYLAEFKAIRPVPEDMEWIIKIAFLDGRFDGIKSLGETMNRNIEAAFGPVKERLQASVADLDWADQHGRR